MDPAASLGLSSDCIASYCIGDVIRAHSLEVPELLPCGYLVGDNNIITVNLKGKTQRIFLQALYSSSTHLSIPSFFFPKARPFCVLCPVQRFIYHINSLYDIVKYLTQGHFEVNLRISLPSV